MFYFELSKSQIHVNIFPQYIWIKLWPHTHNQVFFSTLKHLFDEDGDTIKYIYTEIILRKLEKLGAQKISKQEYTFTQVGKNWASRKYQNRKIIARNKKLKA